VVWHLSIFGRTHADLRGLHDDFEPARELATHLFADSTRKYVPAAGGGQWLVVVCWG
jgi:hypothetical protein